MGVRSEVPRRLKPGTWKYLYGTSEGVPLQSEALACHWLGFKLDCHLPASAVVLLISSSIAALSMSASPSSNPASAKSGDQSPDEVVVRAGWGMYYDLGELFTYLSPGFASGVIAGGPFGVNQSPPFVNSQVCSD